MKRNNVIEGLWHEFMAKTDLDYVSTSESIGEALKQAIERAYGAGFDMGYEYTQHENSKAVLKLDEYGNVLERYHSINKAAKAVGGHASNIRAVVRSVQHTAYGFGWRFEETNSNT